MEGRQLLGRPGDGVDARQPCRRAGTGAVPQSGRAGASGCRRCDRPAVCGSVGYGGLFMTGLRHIRVQWRDRRCPRRLRLRSASRWRRTRPRPRSTRSVRSSTSAGKSQDKLTGRREARLRTVHRQGEVRAVPHSPMARSRSSRTTRTIIWACRRTRRIPVYVAQPGLRRPGPWRVSGQSVGLRGTMSGLRHTASTRSRPLRNVGERDRRTCQGVRAQRLLQVARRHRPLLQHARREAGLPR